MWWVGAGKRARIREPRGQQPAPLPSLRSGTAELPVGQESADTLRLVLRPRDAQLPLPSLPILLAARRGSNRSPKPWQLRLRP